MENSKKQKIKIGKGMLGFESRSLQKGKSST
jgi:hypothetical protein